MPKMSEYDVENYPNLAVSGSISRSSRIGDFGTLVLNSSGKINWKFIDQENYSLTLVKIN